jgi:thioesterase domain-containing protein
MAAHYLREIRAVQPVGPYFIGGYCFGGTVAFEMAQQLHAEGQTVAVLALLDAYAPTYSRLLLWARGTYYRIVCHLANLATRGARKQFGYARETLGTARTRIEARIRSALPWNHPVEFPGLRALRAVQAANERALYRYAPRTYPGRMILFRPSQQAAEYAGDSEMGWHGLAAGGLDVVEIPGRHESIIVEPQVRVLAERLHACLEAARARAHVGPATASVAVERPPA